MSVLRFPQRNKGRIRKAASMDAAGCLSLRLLDRHGEPAPPNVVRIDQPQGPDTSTPDRSPALLMALAVFSTLTGEQKAKARDLLKSFALDGERSAIQLCNMFGLYDAVARFGP